MSSPTTVCYRFDEDGYYTHSSLCQIVDDVPLLAKNSTLVEPPADMLETHFLKWNADTQTWTPEAKPTTAAECVAVGELPHESQTERVHELRELFDSLCEGSETHRVYQDPDTLAKRVEEIPAEEDEAEEADAALAEFDSALADLKDRMSLAVLMGDDDEVASLRTEYQELMNQLEA